MLVALGSDAAGGLTWAVTLHCSHVPNEAPGPHAVLWMVPRRADPKLFL